MDETTAREFFRFCVRVLGQGFHPDTRFHAYVDGRGEFVFTTSTSHYLDRLLSEAMDAIAEAWQDPYEVAIAIMLENET